jgi:hypothetical protein
MAPRLRGTKRKLCSFGPYKFSEGFEALRLSDLLPPWPRKQAGDTKCLKVLSGVIKFNHWKLLKQVGGHVCDSACNWSPRGRLRKRVVLNVSREFHRIRAITKGLFKREGVCGLTRVLRESERYSYVKS